MKSHFSARPQKLSPTFPDKNFIPIAYLQEICLLCRTIEKHQLHET